MIFRNPMIILNLNIKHEILRSRRKLCKIILLHYFGVTVSRLIKIKAIYLGKIGRATI